MPIFIRLTEYRDSDTKEQQFANSANRYIANQNDFSKIPGSPIAYWVSKNIYNTFSSNMTIGKLSPPKTGMTTGDDNRFLRQWHEVALLKTNFCATSLEVANESNKKWFPYNKGGIADKWYGFANIVVNWENDGDEIKTWVVNNPNDPNTTSWSRRIFNYEYFFKEGATWTLLNSSGKLNMRYLPYGQIMNVNGPSLFPQTKDIIFSILSFLNTKVSSAMLSILSPTLANNPGDIAKLPMLFSISSEIKSNINGITQKCIDISREEWDSRETSWDFKQNELIRHKMDDGKIASSFSVYCDYWRKKFTQLYTNEEELNRLFIDIYELQDELTPDVDLGDITILKQESKIVDGELVFQADEIMKQFISYGVGCMFGRYSLDQEGLVVANMNQEIPTSTTFEIDDDNVIPVLEDDYFTDDIASRFIEFVKVAFGAEHHAENIRFIEDALGTTIRKYFVKGFYDDHIKRYKKRPIYWMVSSPKKSFNALIYMHRYQDDIFARIQNNYLREYISKLEASSHTAMTIANDESNSSTDRKKATKEIDDIAKKLDEIIKFDRDKLTQFAQSRTTIDLDDGVKVNYCKFEEILYPISGLCK